MRERYLQQLSDFLIKNAVFVMVICFICVVMAGLGAQRLAISNDYRVFFSADNPQLAAQDALEARYSKIDNVALVLRWDQGDIFSPARLKVIRTLTEDLWQVSHVTRVDSLSNFQRTQAFDDDLLVGDLITGRLSARDIDDVRNVALAEPLLLNRIISADARTTLVNATIQYGEGAGNPQALVAAQVRALASRYELENPGLHIALTGIVMLSNAFEEATQHDLKTLFPLMGLALSVTMVLLMGSWVAATGALLVVAMSVGSVMGLGGWLAMVLNPASGIAPVVIMTVAIADSIHMGVSVISAMKRGLSREDAIADALRVNFSPIFLTSMTTAIGFLSLNFSDAPPFRDLGNLCALGTILAFLISVIFLPAYLSRMPMGPFLQAGAAASRRGWLVAFVVARRRLIVWATLVACGVFAVFLPRMEINDRFVEFFAPGTEFRDDADFVSWHLPGVYFMDFSVPSGSEGGIVDPAYLVLIDRFGRWLRDQPGVTHVEVFSDTMRRLNKNLHGDDPAYFRLPEDRETAAQYLLLYEFSLPFGLDLNNRIDISKYATRITATLDNISSRQLQVLKAKAENWLKEQGGPDHKATGTGISTIFSFLTERNVRSMFWGTGFALVLISALMVVALKSVKMGVISLLPNLTPPIFAFGLWAIMVGEVGLYAGAVTASALGLIVDFTVHFLSKYQRARHENALGPEAAVDYAFQVVGRALWVSAGVLLMGFGVLAFSDFLINANLGLMTAMIIAIALATDFLLLPAILLLLDGKTVRA